MKKVSVIIINYNTAQLTEKVIKTLLLAEKDLEFKIILIDNHSVEPLPRENFLKFGIVPIYNYENLGFAKAVNMGLRMVEGDYVLLLNSDVLVSEGSISRMIEDLNDKVGIVGPQMNFPDGRFQASYGKFPTLWSEIMRFTLLYKIIPNGTFAINSFFKKINIKNSYQVDWVSGGCMLFSRELLNTVKRFDDNYFLGVEDIDFCLSAKKAGFKTLYCPTAKVIHYHGHSSGGTRSLKRIEYDRDGFDYYFKKNFPNKIITRMVVGFMHDSKKYIILSLLKIKSLKIVFKLKITN